MFPMIPRWFTNLGLRVLSATVGLARPSSSLCFFSPTYDSNVLSVYRFVVDNHYHERYGLSVVWLVTRRFSMARVGFEGASVDVSGLWGVVRYLRCRVIVAANNLFAGDRPGAKNRHSLSIQLWHGLPIKKRIRGFSFNHRVFDVFASTSDYASYLLASYLGAPVEKFRVTGYPRNDKLLRDNSVKRARRVLGEVLGANPEEYEKIVLYAPTFRKYDYAGHLEIGRLGFIRSTSRETLVLVKPHPVDEARYGHLLARESRRSNLVVISNSLLLRRGYDVYDLLPAVDILVTDYSSIFNDYILLNKPVVFYMPDIDLFYRHEGLIYPRASLAEILPGPLFHTDRFDLESINYEDYRHRASAFRKLLHEYVDDKSTQRVWNIIQSFLEEPQTL